MTLNEKIKDFKTLLTNFEKLELIEDLRIGKTNYKTLKIDFELLRKDNIKLSVRFDISPTGHLGIFIHQNFKETINETIRYSNFIVLNEESDLSRIYVQSIIKYNNLEKLLYSDYIEH